MSLYTERYALWSANIPSRGCGKKAWSPPSEELGASQAQVYARDINDLECLNVGCSPWQKWTESGYQEPRVSSPIIKMPLAPPCVVWIPLRLTSHCPQSFTSLIKEADTSECAPEEVKLDALNQPLEEPLMQPRQGGQMLSQLGHPSTFSTKPSSSHFTGCFWKIMSFTDVNPKGRRKKGGERKKKVGGEGRKKKKWQF